MNKEFFVFFQRRMSDEEKEEALQPEKMKVNELKSLLNERGLDTKGVKAVLVSRLREALTEEQGGVDEEEIGEEIKIDTVESLQEEKPTKDERIIDTGQTINSPLQIEKGFDCNEEGSSRSVIEATLESDHKSELMALIDRAADDKLDEMEMSPTDLKVPQEEKPEESNMSSVINIADAIAHLDKSLEEVVEKIDEEDKTCDVLDNDENAHPEGIEDKNLEKRDVQDVSIEFDVKLSKHDEEEERKGVVDAETSKECTQLTDVASSGGEKKEEEVKTDIMDDIIKTMDTLTETLDKSKDEAKTEIEAERDLSSVEPNRDADEIVIADEVIIKNPDDVQSVEKLSRELSKLKVVVLELTNYFPHFQPRSKEKLLLNLPFKDKKSLDETQMDEFKTALNQLSFNSNLSNSGVGNLAELLASVSSARLVKDKLGKLIRNVAELSDQLVDYAGHLKRKQARRGEEERSKSKSKEVEGKTMEKVEGETIGKAKVAIFRRKGDFPIIGVSERDISPIRENFDIKKVRKISL